MLDALETTKQAVDIKVLQAPLRARYANAPLSAMVTDRAMTRSGNVDANQPLYGEIEFADPNHTRLPISLHHGVGGKSDLPVPGDVFCAAIASCLDSTIRVIANMMGLRLKRLEVDVEGDADLRGALRMDANVPTAFQQIRLAVNIVPENTVPKEQLDAILAAAEQSCVILQTLQNPPTIEIERV